MLRFKDQCIFSQSFDSRSDLVLRLLLCPPERIKPDYDQYQSVWQIKSNQIKSNQIKSGFIYIGHLKAIFGRDKVLYM